MVTDECIAKSTVEITVLGIKTNNMAFELEIRTPELFLNCWVSGIFQHFSFGININGNFDCHGLIRLSRLTLPRELRSWQNSKSRRAILDRLSAIFHGLILQEMNENCEA
jgi:hypothetical protein